MLEWIQTLDSNLLLLIQTYLRPAFLDPLMVFYTHLGDAGILWIVLSCAMLIPKKTRRAGFWALGAIALGGLCTNVVLKNLFERPRPYLDVEGLLPLITTHDVNSFPSGHTCAAFAAAVVWWRTLPKRWMGILGLVMATLMGLSRLYVGIHYPSDVLAGALVGTLCALVMWYLSGRWQARTLQNRGNDQ